MRRENPTLADLRKTACAHRNQHLLNDPNSGSLKPKKQNKFHNEPVEFDGKKFQSTKERDRYITLRHKLKSEEIMELVCQQEFILESEGQKVASYFADFTYTVVKTGDFIVEDVKSKATRRLAVYRLKKKLMMAIYKIEIKEV